MLRFIALLLIASFSVGLLPVQAQTQTDSDTAAGAEATTSLECSDFYSPANITTSFFAVPERVAPNETVSFTGTIENAHPSPLLGVNVHAKIFKRYEASVTAQSGDTLVEQVVVSENNTIPANGRLQSSYNWIVPAVAAPGQYYAVFFVTAGGNELPIMGYTVADDAIPGQVDFMVVNDGYTAHASFDRASLTVNGRPYIVANPERLAATAEATVEITLVNPTTEAKTMPVQWNTYTRRTAQDAPLIASQTELVNVAAGESTQLRYTLPDPIEGEVYVTAVTQDGAAKEIVNVTIARTGTAVPALEIPFMSLPNFPLVAGQPALVFACLSALTNFPPVDLFEINLRLTTETGEVIHEYYYQGTARELLETNAFGQTFIPTENHQFATLAATVSYQGDTLLASTLTYDCSTDAALCTASDAGVTQPTEERNTSYVLLAVVILVLILIGIIAAVMLKKKQPPTSSTPPTSHSSVTLNVLFIALVLGALPSFAAAQSCAPLVTGYISPTDSSDIILYQGTESQDCRSLCSNQMLSESGTRYCNSEANLTGVQLGFVVPDVGLGSGTWVYTCRLSQQPTVYSNPYLSFLNWSNWSASTCSVPTPPPTPAGTISGIGCAISPGGASCNGSVNWSTSNASSPSVRNDTTGTQYSTATAGNSAASLSHGVNAVVLRDGGAELNRANLSAVCSNGSTWNGATCAPTPPPPASGSVSGTGCSIANGASTCVGRVNWSISNAASPNVRNVTTNVQLSTSPTGSNIATTLAYGGNVIEIRNGSTALNNTTLTASCVSGTSWNGSSCANVVTTPPPPTTPPPTTPQSCTWQMESSVDDFVFTGSNSNMTCPAALRCFNMSPAVTAAMNGQQATPGNPSGCILNCSTNGAYRYLDEMKKVGPGCSVSAPSATISGNTCAIAAGASTCSGTLTWNISNAVSPNVRNNTTNTPYSTDASGNNMSVLLRYGTNSIVARDGDTALNSTTITTTCVGGTSWNGSVCAAASVPPSCSTNQVSFDPAVEGSFLAAVQRCQSAGYTSVLTSGQDDAALPNLGSQPGRCVVTEAPSNGQIMYRYWLGQIPGCGTAATYNLSGTSCTIPTGSSACNGTVTWSSTDVVTPNVRNTTNGVLISSNPAGTDVTAPLQYGANIIALRNSATTLQTATLTTSCEAGSVWNGSSCTVSNTPDVELKVNGQDSATLSNGTPFTLNWTGISVSNCTLWGAGWTGGIAVPTSGSQVVSASVSSNYLISCTGDSDQVAVSVLAQPTVTLLASVNGGGWSGANQTVNPIDTLRLSWSSSDATSCSGVNFNTGGAANNNSGVTATLPAAGSSQTYTINCIGPGGNSSDAITITSRQLANLTAPIINMNPSTTFDPVTGNYASVTVDFGTTNNGGSSTDVPVPYRFEFDRNNDGYEESVTGQFATLNTGASANTSRAVTNVPFGPATVRVTIDHTNSILESNEADNVSIQSIVLPPPPPNLEISASPGLIIRSGDSVTINWDVNATYPMNCSVSGPSLTTITFDPSVNGPTGSALTGPITSQSNYQLSCTEPVTNTTFPPAVIVIETVGSVEEI